MLRATLHFSFSSAYTNEACGNQYPVSDFTQWHTYTVFYDFDKISWYVDMATNPNPVLTVYRFMALNGYTNNYDIPVDCSNNGHFSPGTAVQENESYPQKPMVIIFGDGIVNSNYYSGTGPKQDLSPNSSTVFPNEFD